MTWARCIFNFDFKTIQAIIASTTLLAGCGESPSFQDSDPNKSVVRTSPIGDGSDGSADDLENGGSSNSTAGNGSGSGSSAGGPGNGQGGNGSGGTELPPNLLLASDDAVINVHSNVDILWVVDSSGSMSEEQSYLGQNFNSFMSQLINTGTDFQIGVTSTDICSSTNPAQIAANLRYCPTLDGLSSTHLRGNLVGPTGQKVLSPATNSISSKFLQYANVGIQGSSYEHGLKAAEMAISKSLAGQNEGLVRSNAFLAVIVVSDEEDDGIGLGMTDIYTGRNYVADGLTSVRYTDDNLITYLATAKGAGKFSISAITGTRQANGSLCTSAHSQPQEEGTQYIAAARKTGGIIQSICDTNWSASLASIGQDIAGQSAQIVLSHVPYEATIEVTVNGTTNNQWTFNSGNNAIKFNSGFVPAQGSSVRVNYMYAP